MRLKGLRRHPVISTFGQLMIEIEITGEVTLPLVLNGRRIKHPRTIVSLDVDEVMLGADWLYDWLICCS